MSILIGKIMFKKILYYSPFIPLVGLAIAIVEIVLLLTKFKSFTFLAMDSPDWKYGVSMIIQSLSVPLLTVL